MRTNLILYTLLICVTATLFSGCSASKYARKGKKAFEMGEYTTAITNYKKAYRKDKDRSHKAEYMWVLGESYRSIDQYKYASTWYKNTIKNDGSKHEAYLWYAESLRAMGKFEDAYQTYQLYLDSVPGDQRAINGMESCQVTPHWQNNLTRFEVDKLKSLNSRQSDYGAVFVAGLTNEVIFTSDRDGSTGKRKSGVTGKAHADLFRATFDVQKQKWGKPKPLTSGDDESAGSVNSANDEGTPTLNPMGDQLFFTRCEQESETFNGAQIFMSRTSKGEWSEPIAVQIGGDSIVVAHPSLSNDETTLYFVSDMSGGFGGYDIWRCESAGGEWGKPENLGESINTPGDELFPFIRDNGELYFSTDYRVGMGGLDIYKGTPTEDGFWIVENMRAPINSIGDDFSISFLSQKNRGLFSSNRKGSYGDDIYSFVLPPKVYKANVLVHDAETGTTLPNAYVRVIGTDGTMVKVRLKNGKLDYTLQPETEYIFAAFKKDYLNAKQLINTIGLEESTTFDLKLTLTPTDAPIRVNNINYEFGKAELSTTSLSSLDSLVILLNQNPSTVIEIMSHTDFVGSSAYNSKLSQDRAQSVVNHLISRGVNPRRLVAKGYGESWPLTINKKLSKEFEYFSKGDELTERFINTLETEEMKETAKKLCRRTEFRVLRNDFSE